MKNLNTLPIIGITMGDPLGIGPEIVVKTLNNPVIYTLCKPLILGDSSVIKHALKCLNLKNKAINIIKNPKQGKYRFNCIDIVNISNININKFKHPCIETATAMKDYITRAIEFALNDKIEAIVTCPVTKTALKLAGSNCPGHTEILAEKTGTKNYAMMLAGKNLKVVLVTIHIPLLEVSANLTIKNIIQKIQLTDSALKERFNIKFPKIAVAGLNPHAGEAGMFGEEEKKIITPAVKKARDKGTIVEGPLPPDTVFFQATNGKYDAVICMYHDQGLIPFKLIHFKDGVNTTLGLPIIRTSVDHGTAYDIAWKGIADPTSLTEAVKMAAIHARNRKHSKIQF